MQRSLPILAGGSNRKNLVRFGLGMTKRSYPDWRPKHKADDLLADPQLIPAMRNGYPQFDEQYLFFKVHYSCVYNYHLLKIF